jgi:prepilin-type processing-associated H-X9-DG protein
MIGKINHEIVVPGYDAYTAESVTKVTFPTNTVMFCEQAIGVPFSIGPDPNHFTTIRTPEGEEKGWLRHNNGANYLFCDGHVKWYSPDAVGYNITGTNDGVKPTFAL